MDTQNIIYYSINQLQFASKINGFVCSWSRRCWLVYPALIKDNSRKFAMSIISYAKCQYEYDNLCFAVFPPKYSFQYLHDLCLKLLSSRQNPHLACPKLLFFFVFFFDIVLQLLRFIYHVLQPIRLIHTSVDCDSSSECFKILPFRTHIFSI